VSRQFYLFEQGNIEVLKSLGYEVHGAANFEDANERLDKLDIIRHHFDIQRSPLSLKNLKAYRQLKQIMNSENFDAVHCHSPVGSVLARFAARFAGIKNVIYTVHGFHFYKGAPVINWLVYYPVERILANLTDILITINDEDFHRASTFKAKEVVYVPGIGIDTSQMQVAELNKITKKKAFGIPEDSIVLLSVGELNNNKNHEIVIKSLGHLTISNYIYLICGQGVKETNLKNLVKKLKLDDNVKFLGYRNDVNEIYSISDIFIFPSFREGLSVSLMEAMACSLPVVCSKIRGNVDLIKHNKGGYLLEPTDIYGFSKTISILMNDEKKCREFGAANKMRINKYKIENVETIMKEIYTKLI
jgi:glycosyltransferase involved in cell wall biosynthesis